jgi:pristinamycin I synthase-3/4
VRVVGALDIPALERAFTALVRRHETLRTRILTTPQGQGVQVIDPPAPWPLEVLDLTLLPPAVQEDRVRLLLSAALRDRLVLAEGLCRARLVRLNADRHVLQLQIHHIVSDFWSHRLMLRDLGTLYAASLQEPGSPLPELEVQYADYAVWQREWLQGERLAQVLTYWRTQLAGAPAALELPTDRPRPPVFSYRGALMSFTVPSEQVATLLALSRREGVTLYMLLLAAFQVVLARWSDQTDIVVGSPIAGRTERETEALIGLFVNMLVMRTDLSGQPSFRTVLERVREVTLGAYAHQDLPFEKLVEALAPVRDRARQPLFQVMFNLQNQPVEGSTWPEIELRAVPQEHASSKFELSLIFFTTANGLRGRVEYATDLFDAATITRLVRSLECVLAAVVEDVTASIAT